MASLSGAGVVALLLVVGAAAAFDLQRVEARTLVIYTTPALQDFVEKAAIPAFTAATGIRAVAVYFTASSEYYRLRLSQERPEADVFLHASPLYLEKGAAAGLFEAWTTTAPGVAALDGQPTTAAWHAFAWSPVVSVYAKDRTDAPDLLDGDDRLGLAHPLLSNNGVYVTLLLDDAGPDTRQQVLARTVVQPTNARATIGGVADGSYDLTLGYEAVASFFQGRGANVVYDVPMLGGEATTAPVLFAASLVANHPHDGAEAFLASLLTPEVQGKLAASGLRPVLAGVAGPAGALDLDGVRILRTDWSDWAAIEARLPAYEVKA